MNQATDIVSEHLQQDFVDLRYSRLAAHRISEHALDGRERRLDIRPLVICLQKLFAVQNEVGEQLVPRLRWRRADRVAVRGSVSARHRDRGIAGANASHARIATRARPNLTHSPTGVQAQMWGWIFSPCPRRIWRATRTVWSTARMSR